MIFWIIVLSVVLIYILTFVQTKDVVKAPEISAVVDKLRKELASNKIPDDMRERAERLIAYHNKRIKAGADEQESFKRLKREIFELTDEYFPNKREGLGNGI